MALEQNDWCNSLTLKGERITLCSPIPEHDEATLELLNNQEAMTWLLNIIPSSGFSISDIQKRREGHKKLQQQKQRLQFSIMINNKEGKEELIGICGLSYVDFANQRGEFGIILHPRVWRKGYCGEAYDLVAHFAFMELRLHRLCSETRAENVGMISFFKKRGFKSEGEFEDHILDVDGKFKNVVVYGLLKTKYLGLLEHKP